MSGSHVDLTSYTRWSSPDRFLKQVNQWSAQDHRIVQLLGELLGTPINLGGGTGHGYPEDGEPKIRFHTAELSKPTPAGYGGGFIARGYDGICIEVLREIPSSEGTISNPMLAKVNTLMEKLDLVDENLKTKDEPLRYHVPYERLEAVEFREKIGDLLMKRHVDTINSIAADLSITNPIEAGAQPRGPLDHTIRKPDARGKQ